MGEKENVNKETRRVVLRVSLTFLMFEAKIGEFQAEEPKIQAKTVKF